MFTGLIEAKVPLLARQVQGPGQRLTFTIPQFAAELRLGDSVAFNGCCLTVIDVQGEQVAVEAGEETLSRTNLGALSLGDLVNVERALAVGDRLGGHYVTGHVDGLGCIRLRRDDGQWTFLHVTTQPSLLMQMASKGSITINGISLTLVEVTDQEFSVALIPHTLQVTTLGECQIGDVVNLETDVLAKYVQRQIEPWRSMPKKP